MACAEAQSVPLQKQRGDIPSALCRERTPAVPCKAGLVRPLHP